MIARQGLPAQPTGRNPGRPDLAGRLDAPDGAVGVLDGDAVAVDVGDHRTQLDFHAQLLQPGSRPLTELCAHRWQHRRGGVKQNHPRLGRVDVPECALQRVLGQLGDLSGHFNTGGASPDNGECQ